MLLIWSGFGCGALVARYVLRFPIEDVVAVALETGIQNTGVAFVILEFSVGQPAADLSIGKFTPFEPFIFDHVREIILVRPCCDRCEGLKKLASFMEAHWCCSTGLGSLLQKTRSSPSKKWTVQPGDAFENTASSLGLNMSNSKPGCRVSVLHSFCEIDTTDGFLALNAFR